MIRGCIQAAKKNGRLIATVAGALFFAFVISGCESLDSVAKLGTSLGMATGQISEEQAASINKSAEAVQKSFEDLTPEQEYYIGRAVGAVILDDYPPYDDQKANDYLNKLGQSLALLSDRPELFKGYRFLILDSDEVNAFATPSGLIFVSRGMLRLTRSEPDVAAVLSHEIGHVVEKHGLKAIKTSRINTALTSVALTSVQLASNEDIAKLTNVFEDSINDITSTLVNNGYSRGAERQADEQAVTILKRTGYDPRALIHVLQRMESAVKPGGPGFGKTHPDPKERIKDVEKLIGNTSGPGPNAVQERRYKNALAGI